MGVAVVTSTLVSSRAALSVIEDPDSCTLKRIAWAFGCARKDSDEERMLHDILVSRVTDERTDVTWTFTQTGRAARVIGVKSTAERDVVLFRFLDNDQTTRSIPARRFLSDFTRNS